MLDQRPPRNRLHEIAQRKLGSLGIPTRPTADGGSLEGELVPGSTGIRNPLSGKPIERVRFVVEGHDKLRPMAPAAVEGLSPISFLDIQRPEPIASQIEQALQKRAATVQGSVLPQMRRLRLEPTVDGERMRAVGRLELTGLGTVGIEGDDRGIRAAWVQPMRGRPAIPLGDLPLNLQEFEHRVDLELHLFSTVEKALTAAPAPSTATPVPGPKVTTLSGTQGGITLAELVEKFGADARIAGPLALVRDMAVGETRVRFGARLDQGKRFLGRLTGANGAIWEEGFDLERFPRLDEFVVAKLGMNAAPATQTPPPGPPGALQFTLGPAAAVQAGGALLGGTILPVTGEIWVMSILVESDTGGEIRYVPVDIDGKPFGAARTLPKADFLATFETAGSVGYRLPARVLEVSATHVTYVQLDPRRQPVGQPKSGTVTMFVHHFVPEAAAY